MAVNQIGAGGLQSINLYRQNQENSPPPSQDSRSKPEVAGGTASFKVEISQESLRLSQQNQGSGVETLTEQQEQKAVDQLATTANSTRQTNAANAPQQVSVDLFA